MSIRLFHFYNIKLFETWIYLKQNGTNLSANIECLASTATFKMTFPPDFVGTVQVRSEQEVTDAACIPAEGTTDGLKDYTVTFDLTGGTTNCPLTHLTAVTDGQVFIFCFLFVRKL